MDLWKFIWAVLVVSFIGHGVAFTILAVKRRRFYYFFLSGTFIFLTALYFIKFEGWQPSVPGTDFPVTWLLRIGATICTLVYLCVIYNIEGSWLWRLLSREPWRG